MPCAVLCGSGGCAPAQLCTGMTIGQILCSALAQITQCLLASSFFNSVGNGDCGNQALTSDSLGKVILWVLVLQQGLAIAPPREIRRALAQGVSEHKLLDSNKEQHPFFYRSQPKLDNFQSKNQHRATAQIVVSCSETRRARGAVREPLNL